MEERLTRLEESLGFAERTVEELHAEVLRAHDKIDRLEALIRRLESRLDLVEQDPPEDEDAAEPDQD